MKTYVWRKRLLRKHFGTLEWRVDRGHRRPAHGMHAELLEFAEDPR
jgi:hypothetical protein